MSRITCAVSVHSKSCKDGLKKVNIYIMENLGVFEVEIKPLVVSPVASKKKGTRQVPF